MTWTAMVAAALALWGAVFPGQVTVVNQDGVAAYANVTSIAWADRWSEAPNCIISVMPLKMAYLTHEQIQRVITHEVGHCFGFEHDSTRPGIMYPDGAQYDLNGYDRAALWRITGAPYRLAVPGIAAD